MRALLVTGGVARGQEETGAKPATPKRSESSDIVGHASSEVSFYSDTDAVTVVTPTIAAGIENPLSEWSVNARFLVDVVSAASVDIVSTASRAWHEVRHEGDFDGSYKFGDLGVSASGSVSREPDYLAWVVGGHLSYDFADKNVTALLGYAFGHDTIGKSDTPFDVYSQSVDRHTFNGAATVVMNPSTLVALVGDDDRRGRRSVEALSLYPALLFARSFEGASRRIDRFRQREAPARARARRVAAEA